MPKKGYKQTPDHKAQILKVLLSPEVRAKQKETVLGGHPSERTRAKMRAYQQSRPPITEETRARMSIALTGRVNTPEARAKISAARLGSTLSPEHRAKIAAAGIGKTHSEETKAKMSAAQIGSWAAGVRIDNTRTIGYFAKFGVFLRNRDGDLCQLCLSPIDFSIPHSTRWARTVDHIVPRRGGGSDMLSNFWLAHLSCNARKGARHIGRPDSSTDAR